MKLTEAESRLLESTEGTWAFCGYDARVRDTAASLERKGLGVIGENDCGPILRITPAGRAVLNQEGRGDE